MTDASALDSYAVLMTLRFAAARNRIERILASEEDPRALRIGVVRELQQAVQFDAYAWLLTDPESWVGASPLAHAPDLLALPTLIRLKYLTPINRWTTLSRDTATTLSLATGGQLSRSLLWRELLRDYRVVDVLSVVFRDQYGCWGFFDLWRIGTSVGEFSAAELDFIGDLVPRLTIALRAGQAATFRQPAGPPHTTVPAAVSGPAVLLLASNLHILGQTPETEHHLRTLLPPDGDANPVPAAAYNVAAQLLAIEAGVDDHPAAARVHLWQRRWLTFRAARMPSERDAGLIAVTIEPTPPAERAALFARACGLSRRETELFQLMLSGGDTRDLAASMFISENTVQDHLKSIFRKTESSTRRAVIARALGV